MSPSRSSHFARFGAVCGAVALLFASAVALGSEDPGTAVALGVHAAAQASGAGADSPIQQFDEQKLGFKPLVGLSPWPINPQDPVSSVPALDVLTKNVLGYGYLLMDLGVEADSAFVAADYERAAMFYQALIKAAPHKSAAFAQLCASQVGLNQLDKALAACRIAVTREGSRAIDYARFVGLTLASGRQLLPEDIKQLDDVFAHLKAEKVDFLPVNYLACDLGVRLEDERRLESCTKDLAAKAPDDPRTITYQWTLATLRRDWSATQRAIEHAERAKLPPRSIALMRSATTKLSGASSSAVPLPLTLAGIAAALGAGALVWKRRRVPHAQSAA